MRLTLSEAQQIEAASAAAAEKGVRRWKRYQAVLLLAEGQAPTAVARTLRCSLASVYNWAAAWRRGGAAGLREGDHGGGRPKLGPAGAAVLGGLLAEDSRRAAIAPRAGRRRCCARSWPASHGSGWCLSA